MIEAISNTHQIIRNQVLRGPITKGLVKAQELNAEFYQLANEKMQKGFMTVEELKTILLKFIPQDFKLRIQPFSKNYLEEDGYYVRYKNLLTIGIKASKEGLDDIAKYKIQKKDDSILMHETFHLFADIFNPKIKARMHSINKPIAKFFQRNIYQRVSILDKLFNWQKRFEKRLNKFLSTIPEEKQVNALQFFRYAIINEALAFNESVKYGAKVNINKELAFEEKYKIIEKTLVEKMEKLRKD